MTKILAGKKKTVQAKASPGLLLTAEKQGSKEGGGNLCGYSRVRHPLPARGAGFIHMEKKTF